jgi:hypothetical protein
MGGCGPCVFFEHAAVPTAGPSAVRFRVCWKSRFPCSQKKIPIQPFLAKIRLENIRWLRYLRDELPTLTVEIAAE